MPNLKKWFIACNKFNTPTAKQLAQKLSISYGTNPKKTRKKIIRWGFGKDLPIRINNAESFPEKESIILCADKLDSLKVMAAAGVTIPRLYTSQQDLVNVVFPLYSRKRHHTMGKDIIIVSSLEEANRQLRNGRYLVESIPVKKEYRVHVFNGEIISISKKYFRQQLWQELGSPEMKDLIRNNENGWGYYDIQDVANINESVKTDAIKAVNSLDLIWGAVDIIRTPNRTNFILEVNSAPGLRDTRVDLYVEKFNQFIENNDQ